MYGGVATSRADGSAAGLLAGIPGRCGASDRASGILFRIRAKRAGGNGACVRPVKAAHLRNICLIMSVAFGTLFNLIAGDFWFWPLGDRRGAVPLDR